MRINQYLAAATGLSRRAADHAIEQGRVRLNGQPARLGQVLAEGDQLTLDGRPVAQPAAAQTIMLNKPVGYVCSRRGQGSQTIYDLLPAELDRLKPVGRLDKNSSGLLIMTTDGNLAQQLTHPSNQKQKLYQIELNSPLTDTDRRKIAGGVRLEDGLSRLALHPLGADSRGWQVALHEGRNRQIRRTFGALGYSVVALQRTEFGPYKLGSLSSGAFRVVQ